MAIPGMKPAFDVVSKIRVGEKVARGGKSFPSALDYFKADSDPMFDELGPRPNLLRITFPYESVDDNFSTGLEMWRGKMLVCYSKGEGTPPIAYRRRTIKQEGRDVDLIGDAEVRGPVMGNDRLPITCTFRECPFFNGAAGKKECRPMGRLVFFLENGRRDGVYELDTKGWNTIEAISKTLVSAALSGPLTGRVFELAVQMAGVGQKRYPLVTLKEAEVKVETNQDVAFADAVIEADGAIQSQDTERQRRALARLLDAMRPGWRNDEQYVARIREVGVQAALSGTHARAMERLAQ